MSFQKAKKAAAEHLVSGANLDELKKAAQDLRALSPGSALADLVDAKIEQIISENQLRGLGEEGA